MQRLAEKLKRTDLPAFVPGDQVRVQVKIKEGDKERLQAFEGLVIAINKGPQGTFTVRKMSFGQGVERIFPFNSKVIDKIEKIRSYKVRRAKLFYIRGLRGKAARLREVDRETGTVHQHSSQPRLWPGLFFGASALRSASPSADGASRLPANLGMVRDILNYPSCKPSNPRTPSHVELAICAT
jgi:large subunit ribosomal protein L19